MRYTKKQILESLKHWSEELAKLQEQSGNDNAEPVTKVDIEEILEELDVFDNYGSWSEVSGPSLGLVKFSSESLKQLEDAFSKYRGFRKGIGLVTVHSRAEYDVDAQYPENEMPSYEDYLEDEIYRMQEHYFNKSGFTKLFAPKKVLVLDDVTLNYEEGKTVLAALYAI